MDKGKGSQHTFRVQDDHGRIHDVKVAKVGNRTTWQTSDGYDVLPIEGGNFWIEQLKCFAHRLD